MAPLLLALALLAASAGGGELVNGDFEKGSEHSFRGWVTIWPPSYTPTPEFAFVEGGARAGEQCAQVHTRYQGGYTSFTQELRVPKGAHAARLTGWIRVAEAGDGVAASLLLSMVHPNGADFENYNTPRVTSVGEWTRVDVSGVVPEGMTKCLVRCGVTGPARVLFDDVELEWITGANLVACRLGYHDTHHDAVVQGESPWIQFSVPLPFSGQTPLAIELASDPPGRIAGAEVVAERENRLLRVRFTPAAQEESIRVSARTYVLFDDQVPADGTKIKLAKVRSVPDDVRQHLGPAPGIESDDERIVAIAKGFSRRNLTEVTRDALAFLGENLGSPDGAYSQSAVECLERGDGVCTGHANLGAALLMAADVPTRVLACVMVGMEQQEHYVIEVWTPKLGWSRAETTTGEFPLPASKHLILRVVYPDSERNAGFAPIYMEAAEGSTVKPGFGALDDGGCWQAGRHLESFFVDSRGLERLRAAATESFESLDVDTADGSLIRIVDAKARSRSGERATAVLEVLDGHLAE